MKMPIATLLIVPAIFYAMGFIGNPLLFIVFVTILFVSLFAAILLLATNLIWKFLPLNIRQLYRNHESRCKLVILVWLIFFLFGGWAINHYFLPDKFHPISLLGDVGILFFMIFVGWNLVKPGKKRKLVPGTAVFILFIFLLTAVGSVTYEHSELSSTEALKSLPYLAWTPAKETIQKSGVTKYDRKHSFKGINIYNSSHLSAAYLIDMAGNILHTWSAKIDKDDSWHHIEMCKNGDLLAIIRDVMLIRLDWNSNIKWIKKTRAHHDISIAGNNDIYILGRRDEVVFIFGLPVPILNDYIVVLSPDGEIKKEISLFKLLKQELSFNKVIKIYISIINTENLWEVIKRKAEHSFIFARDTPPDIFHNNTIEIIDRNINGLCKKGDILLSVRQLDLIGIIDVTKGEVVWRWGPGNLSLQHHPTLLENGNILIFDNGVERKYSRIVELDPLKKKIVWEYEANPQDQFYSRSRGSSQQLPNGNTLITDSDNGHVFEITRARSTVWEFYNPEINMSRKERATIYRMMRITDPENFPRLRKLFSPSLSKS